MNTNEKISTKFCKYSVNVQKKISYSYLCPLSVRMKSSLTLL